MTTGVPSWLRTRERLQERQMRSEVAVPVAALVGYRIERLGTPCPQPSELSCSPPVYHKPKFPKPGVWKITNLMLQSISTWSSTWKRHLYSHECYLQVNKRDGIILTNNFRWSCLRRVHCRITCATLCFCNSNRPRQFFNNHIKNRNLLVEKIKGTGIPNSKSELLFPIQSIYSLSTLPLRVFLISALSARKKLDRYDVLLTGNTSSLRKTN